MRYNARASIAPDEEFKRDIKLIRTEAEQKYVGDLIKFHYRRVERNKIKLRKLEQETRRSTVMTGNKDKPASSASETNDTQEREDIQEKIKELKKELSNSENCQNKGSESYSSLPSMSTAEYNKDYEEKKHAISSKKRNERKKKLRRDIEPKSTEAKKKQKPLRLPDDKRPNWHTIKGP